MQGYDHVHGPVTQHGTIRSLHAMELNERGGRTQQEQQAYELGAEHARRAASWIEASEAQAQALLAMFEDGDPAIYDYLPREPNLSGEFADDPTPASLWETITGEQVDTFADLHSDAPGLAISALCDAYEEGVAETFTAECERILRAPVGGPEDTIDALYTEDGLNRAVRAASDAARELSDDEARAVASAWHDGQSSAFYAFASSGHFDRDALLRELSDTIHTSYTTAAPGECLQLDMLGTYLLTRGD